MILWLWMPKYNVVNYLKLISFCCLGMIHQPPNKNGWWYWWYLILAKGMQKKMRSSSVNWTPSLHLGLIEEEVPVPSEVRQLRWLSSCDPHLICMWCLENPPFAGDVWSCHCLFDDPSRLILPGPRTWWSYPTIIPWNSFHDSSKNNSNKYSIW